MGTTVIAQGRVDVTVRSLNGEDALRRELELRGFRCAQDPTRHQWNECNWYAYRRSDMPARPCECNSEKPGMQIVVKPSVMTLNGTKHRSVEVELRGETGGMWWNLSAYGISPEDLPGKLPDVEAGLIAAWNALRPNG